MPFLSNSRSRHSISKSLFFLWLLVMERWLCAEWFRCIYSVHSYHHDEIQGLLPSSSAEWGSERLLLAWGHTAASHQPCRWELKQHLADFGSMLRILFRGTASLWRLCPCLETNMVTDLSTAAKWDLDTLFPSHTPFHTDGQIWNVHALTSKYKFQGGGSLCLGQETRGAG